MQPDLGTTNFGDDVFLNPWPFMSDLYQLAQEREVVPEFELFDLGQVHALGRLIEVRPPVGGKVHVDFVTGVPGGMPGTAAALVAGVAALPPEVTSWSATGIGRSTLAVAHGLAVDGRPPAGRDGGRADHQPRRAGRVQRPARRACGRPRPDRPADADDARPMPGAPRSGCSRAIARAPAVGSATTRRSPWRSRGSLHHASCSSRERATVGTLPRELPPDEEWVIPTTCR